VGWLGGGILDRCIAIVRLCGRPPTALQYYHQLMLISSQFQASKTADGQESDSCKQCNSKCPGPDFSKKSKDYLKIFFKIFLSLSYYMS